MPHFIVCCVDREGAGDLRARTRAHHLEFLERLGPAVRLAGPMTREGTAYGSLLIVEAADRIAASAILAGDPYAEAGFFETVDVVDWTPVVVRFAG